MLQLGPLPPTCKAVGGPGDVNSAETGAHGVDCSPSRSSTSNTFSTACSKSTLSAVLSYEERLPAGELVCHALALTRDCKAK